MKSKRGQLTIFIILALVIIFVIIILLVNQGNIFSIFQTQSPVEQITECTQNALRDGIEVALLQGGAIEPTNYFLYQGNKIDYICYTNEDYKPCKMQKPILKSSVEQELKEHTEEKIKQCVQSAKVSIEKKGNTVTYDNPEVSIEILPNNVFADIELNMQIHKDESTQSYKNIKTGVNSKLYEFIAITSSIANDEVSFGDIETLGYMLANQPWLKIEKKKQIEGTKIFILTNRESEEQFFFASRSYTMPPGAIK
jgi:hypothetical protein